MLDRKISKGKNLNYSPNYFNHPRSTKKWSASQAHDALHFFHYKGIKFQGGKPIRQLSSTEAIFSPSSNAKYLKLSSTIRSGNTCARASTFLRGHRRCRHGGCGRHSCGGVR